MTPYHAPGRNNKRYEYYKCTRSQHGGTDACLVRPAPARALEGLVVSRIQQLAQEPALIQKAIKRTVRKSNADLPNMKANLEKNASRRRKIEDEAERLMKRFSETGAESNTFLIKHLNQLEAEMKGLEEQESLLRAAIEAESVQAMDPEAAQKALVAFTKLYAAMDSEERQHMLRLTVREVVYNGDVRDIKMSLHPVGDGGSILDKSADFAAVRFGSASRTAPTDFFGQNSLTFLRHNPSSQAPVLIDLCSFKAQSEGRKGTRLVLVTESPSASAKCQPSEPLRRH